MISPRMNCACFRQCRIAFLFLILVAPALHAETKITIDRDGESLRRCPPVAFLLRADQGRKGTNATMLGQRTASGSEICVFDPARPGAAPRSLFKTEEGFIFDMSPSFDGKKILFSLMESVKPAKGSFHIWEIDVDGKSDARQITDGPWHDASAVYLPDGRIVFCSTRVESFAVCQNFLAAALYVVNPDGTGIARIEYNTLCDTTPFVMDDGSILFTRWEYQDKNIFCVEGLWTLNPDGKRLQLYYGNTLTIPNAIYGAKQIPGTRKVLAVGAGHHSLPIGAIYMIDRSHGFENPKAMTNLTPEIDYKPRVAKHWKDDYTDWQPGDKKMKQGYTDPYPIAEDLFLVSYNDPKEKAPGRFRLALLDDQGKKEILYDDGKLSSLNPIPLHERPLPHQIPGDAPEIDGEGEFFVADIYKGLIGKGVRRGQIKQLRVMSQIPKKYNTEGKRYHDHYPVMGYGSYYAKYAYGTVPVYPDGTAYFKAPAGPELYFIALDKSGKEVRRMGTVTQITKGERQGCIGCHESRSMAPSKNPAVLKRLAQGPDAIKPEPWGAGPVSFIKMVQPVLDKHCADCHSGRTPQHGYDFSADRTRFFNMAYRSLIDNGLVEYYYLHDAPTGNFPPMKSGSMVSKICKIIDKPHNSVKVPPEDRRRIYAWIDANAPYFGTWDMTRPHTMGGRDAWDVEGRYDTWFKEFETLYTANCAGCHKFKKDELLPPHWINLTRPEHSRVLNAHLSKELRDHSGYGIKGEKDGKISPFFENTDDALYQELLQAIEKGKTALQARPRIDMPGAKPIAQERDFGKLY